MESGRASIHFLATEYPSLINQSHRSFLHPLLISYWLRVGPLVTSLISKDLIGDIRMGTCGIFFLHLESCHQVTFFFIGAGLSIPSENKMSSFAPTILYGISLIS